MLIGQTISKQAIQKRTNASFVSLLKELLSSLLKNTAPKEDTHKLLSPFNRVLLQDSTTVSLSPSLAMHFPGSRNQSDKTFAQIKIQTIIDIKAQRYQKLDITAFTRTDQAAATDIIPLLQPKDLVLRDLGYFVIKTMKEIIKQKAFFCSRLRYGVSAFDSNSKKEIDLLEVLKQKGSADMEVIIGAGEQMPVRLVALPVPVEIAAQRRRKLKANRDRRCKPTPMQLKLCDWVIFITNIPRTTCSKEQIRKIYELRWRIEILFKTWKSNCHFTEFPPTASKVQVESFVFARLIVVTLYELCDVTKMQNCPVSILKLAKFNADFFWLQFGYDILSITEDFQLILIQYFCRYEKRKKRKNYNEKVNILFKDTGFKSLS